MTAARDGGLQHARRRGAARLAPLTYDYRVFLFALTVPAAATVLFALLPVIQASRLC